MRKREADRTYLDVEALTAAEAALLDMLAEGAKVDAAAASLGISKKTAQNRLSASYEKLGVKGLKQAIALWSERRIAA